jgi:hypothetical protein
MYIKVATWNTQGALLKKLKKVTTQMSVYDLHVMVLTGIETCGWREEASSWVQEDDSGEKYTIMRTQQVACIVRGDMDTIPWWTTPNGRGIVVKVPIDEQQEITIAGVYHRPASSTEADTTYQELEQILESQGIEADIVLGDFNARIGTTDDRQVTGRHARDMRNDNTEDFLEFMGRHNLCSPSTYQRRKFRQIWTWRHRSSRRCYQQDHILVPRRDLGRAAYSHAVGKLTCSDHRTVVMKYRPPWQRRTAIEAAPVRGNITRAQAAHPDVQEAIQAKLEGVLLPRRVASVRAVERMTDDIVGQIQAAMNQAITAPSRSRRISRDLKRAQDEFKEARKLLLQRSTRPRRRAKKEALKTLSKVRRRDRRRERRIIAKDIRAAHKKGDSKMVYEGLKALRRIGPRKVANKNKFEVALMVNGQKVTSVQDKLEVFAVHLEALHSPPTRDGAGNATPRVARVREHIDPPAPPDGEEVKEALLAVKVGRRGGLDNIPPETLRLPGVQSFMTKLIRGIWETRKVPQVIAESGIVMILKAGKSAAQVSNYRPIALQSVFRRAIETLLLKRMSPCLEVKRAQTGFIRHAQVTEHVVAIRMLAEETRKNRGELNVLFLDLARAYDSVPHLKMLQCLRNRNVPGIYIEIIQDLFQKSTGKVLGRDGKTSRPIHLGKGLPQGGPLSPSLFNVYLDEIISNSTFAEGPVRILAYADDVVLLAPDLPQLRRQFEEIGTLLREYEIAISITKCGWMRLAGPQMDDQLRHSLPVPHLEKYRYLGVEIAMRPKDDTMIAGRTSQAYRALYGMTEMLKVKEFPLQMRYDILKAVVFPKVLYGSEALALSRTACDKLDSFHLHAIRIIKGGRVEETLPELMDMVEEPLSLGQQARIRRLNFAFHSLRRTESIIASLFSAALLANAPPGKKSYVADLREEMKILSEELNMTVQDLAADRNLQKKSTRDLVERSGLYGKIKCGICGHSYKNEGEWYIKHLEKHHAIQNLASPQQTHAGSGG